MPGNLTEVVGALTSTTVAAGGIFSFSARASNIGNTSTGGASTSRILLSVDPLIDPFDTVLQIQVVPTLAAFSEYVQNFVVNLPANLAPGTYYVGGLADFNNQIGETNEGDNNYNFLTLTVTPPVYPNLTEVVTALTSTTVPAGTNFSFATNTVNIGQNTAAGSTARIYISSDPIITAQDTLLASHASSSLNPGAGSAQNFAVNLPGNLAPGTYYIGGLADYFNQVGESNEGDNNGNILTITVTAPPAPNLTEVVTALTSTTVSPGGLFSFAATAANSGNATAAGSTSRIFLSSDPIITGQDTVLAIQTVGSLAPGATLVQNYQVALPSNLAPGTYYIGGLADYHNQVGESNESDNNNNLITITVPAPPPAAFSINFNYSGDQQYLQYFTAAAARWSQVVTGDLPDVNSAQYGFVDDLLINVSIAPIDGVGGILGQAGPDASRAGANGLPYHGSMTFDSADVANLVANGTFGSVVLHEIGHILGIGSLWNSFGLRSGSNYIGANGVAAYRLIANNNALNSVPLETGGGSGTALVHWSEAVFNTELMTGFSEAGGVAMPLSILTIGGLADLGYQVNYGAADPYSLLVAGSESSASGAVTVVNSGTTTIGSFLEASNLTLANCMAGSFADTGGCRADPAIYGEGFGEAPPPLVPATPELLKQV